jgi:hypothetical protein
MYPVRVLKITLQYLAATKLQKGFVKLLRFTIQTLFKIGFQNMLNMQVESTLQECALQALLNIYLLRLLRICFPGTVKNSNIKNATCLKTVPFFIYTLLCKTAQENVMNPPGGICLFHVVVIKPNNNQYYADNHLVIIWVSIPKDSITGQKIKNNIDIHFPRATGSGLGCLQVSTPLSRSILVESY